MLDVLLDGLLGHAHLGGVGGVRHPLGRVAGSGLLEHLVDLLESETLGLGDEEVGVDKAAGAEGAPDVEDLGAQVALVLVNHVGGNDGDDAIPQPVGCGGQGNTTGSDLEREDLADDDPGTGSPGGGEEGNVDADEGDHGLGSGGVGGEDGTDDGNNELADDHAQSTPDEDGTTSEALNSPEGERGREDVDQGGDERDQEGVVDNFELLEEGGTKVENEVDTSPLLHHLERGTKNSTAEVGGSLEERTAEAVEPAVEVATLGDDGDLVLVVGNNLSKLVLDVVGVGTVASKAGQNTSGLVELALANEVTGGLGEEEQANGQDDGPKHLQTNRDSVGAAVLAILGTIVDGRGKEETDGDAELVSRHDRATDFAGSNLRHVLRRPGLA